MRVLEGIVAFALIVAGVAVFDWRAALIVGGALLALDRIT